MNRTTIESLLRSLAKHKAYMDAYNKRPDVKAKRRQYNSDRWKAMKAAREIAKEEGLI